MDVAIESKAGITLIIEGICKVPLEVDTIKYRRWKKKQWVTHK